MSENPFGVTAAAARARLAEGLLREAEARATRAAANRLKETVVMKATVTEWIKSTLAPMIESALAENRSSFVFDYPWKEDYITEFQEQATKHGFTIDTLLQYSERDHIDEHEPVSRMRFTF